MNRRSMLMRPDPSGTTMNRRAMRREMDRRWFIIRREIKEETNWMEADKVQGRFVEVMVNTLVTSWMDHYVENAYISGLKRGLELVGGKESNTFDEGPWSVGLDSYVQAAAVPDHLDYLKVKASEDLLQIIKVTAGRLANIENANRLASSGKEERIREVVREIDKVGVVRSRVLTSTEPVRASNIGLLDGLRMFGVSEVRLIPELDLSSGKKVCPLCSAYEGTYPILKAYKLLPLHPSCRCSFEPVRIHRESLKSLVFLP